MLVLSRKIGEQVVIGEAIEVVVLAIHGSHVKLGLTAPPAVPFHRGEVRDRFHDANRARNESLHLGLSETGPHGSLHH